MNNLTTGELEKLAILLTGFEDAVAFDYGITPFNGGAIEIELDEADEMEICFTLIFYDDSNSETIQENLSIDRCKLNEWDGVITDSTYNDLING